MINTLVETIILAVLIGAGYFLWVVLGSPTPSDFESGTWSGSAYEQQVKDQQKFIADLQMQVKGLQAAVEKLQEVDDNQGAFIIENHMALNPELYVKDPNGGGNWWDEILEGAK